MNTTSRQPSAPDVQETTRGNTSFHQVLILLGAGASLFLVGGSKTLADRTRDAIEDESRREAAGLIADEIEQAKQRVIEQFVESRDDFFDVARRHEATGPEIDAALSRGVEEAERFQRELLELRSRLKQQVTSTEWSEVFPDPGLSD